MPTVVHTTGNQKVALLKAMLENADGKGRVRCEMLTLVHTSTLDLHDVTKVAWALQKQGLLKFRESKRTAAGGATSALSDLVLIDLERIREMVKVITIDEASAATIRSTPLPEEPKRPEVAAEAVTEPWADIVRSPALRLLASVFPEMSKIIGRSDQVKRAAEMLSDAGLDDLAIQALDALTYSPLEAEVVLLVSNGLVKFVAEV